MTLEVNATFETAIKNNTLKLAELFKIELSDGGIYYFNF